MVKNILTLIFLRLLLNKGYKINIFKKWFSDINNSSRGEYYSKFKTDFKLENYVFRLNAVHRKYICKLRTSNKTIPIERVFLWMKDYAIYVIHGLKMNSIMSFVVSY